MPLHVINFTGPVTASTCSQLIEKASLAVQQEASGLVVNIATMGGECSYGFTMYNFLLALPISVQTTIWAPWSRWAISSFWPVSAGRRASTVNFCFIRFIGMCKAPSTIRACPNTP